MDGLAGQALVSIQGAGVPVETKLKYLTDLKAEIKHRHCPEVAVGPLFDVIRLSLATPHLTDAGFSILGHLTKRLELQDQISLLHTQGAKTYPSLLDRLGDPKDRIRQRAIQALIDFHSVAPADVEQFVRDNGLTGRNPRVKEAGMHWVATIRRDRNMPFRAFVPHIVDCLEDADGSVRQTAQATIIELFRNAGTKETNDLQKHLRQRNVRKSIVEHILAELDVFASNSNRPPSPIEKHGSEPSRSLPISGGDTKTNTNHIPLEAPPMSISEQEAVQLDPIYVETSKDLDETFREMHPHFEGKETEQNWLKREKSILRMRKITKGNAPQEFTTVFLGCMKALLDGILKTVNSLRTTVCTIGCHLIQDVARVAGSGLDNMIEILLQNLVKLCASTKKIAASKGNDTVATILANVSYNIRLIQHIHSACQDKNVQPRIYAGGWLKVIIDKHGHQKNAIEHAGGLDLIEKSLKIGLVDRDPNVRESMRPTYWAFARRWSDKSELIMSTLDERNQKALINHPANPTPDQPPLGQPTPAGSKSALSKSTTSVPPRPSIKETIAQKKAAKAAGKNLLSRPGSAEPFGSPKKATSHLNLARPGTAMSTTSRNVSTTSVGTLSSAPVRPRRRADIARPATADPYASRKVNRTETPPRSPAVSPVKRVKTPALTANSVVKKVDSPAANSSTKYEPSSSEVKAAKGGRNLGNTGMEVSPTKAAEDFTMVMPNMKAPKSTAITPPSRFPQKATLISPVHVSNWEDPFSQDQPKRSQDAETFENGSDRMNASPISSRPRISPMKPVSDFRSSLSNEEKNQRISMSPRAIGSRKENLGHKNPYTHEERPLRVYEDPVCETTNGYSYPPPRAHTPRALEELPINEPAKDRRILDPQLLAEEPQSPEYHQKWLAIEATERRHRNSPENTENPYAARKILDSATDRLRARTLDVQGFRKLQAVIRTSTHTVWEDGYKFDELIMPLLEFLESPSKETTPRASKIHDLKIQGLVTVRLLLQHQTKHFPGYFPRALISVLNARKYYNSTSHIVCGLEETAESIVHQCDPLPCLDSVVDLLRDQSTDGAETHTVYMGLYVLAGLLHRKHEGNFAVPLSNELEADLGQTGARFLTDTNPDVRRAVIEFVLELYDSMEHDRFWPLVVGDRDDLRSLITYYLARKRGVAE